MLFIGAQLPLRKTEEPPKEDRGKEKSCSPARREGKKPACLLPACYALPCTAKHSSCRLAWSMSLGNSTLQAVFELGIDVAASSRSNWAKSYCGEKSQKEPFAQATSGCFSLLPSKLSQDRRGNDFSYRVSAKSGSLNPKLETLSPRTLNPKPLNPKPLNPKPLNPKPLNP